VTTGENYLYCLLSQPTVLSWKCQSEKTGVALSTGSISRRR